MEGWVDIMYFGMDSVSIWTWIYYFFMILIGAFILINLTLAIILSKFNEGRSIVRIENLFLPPKQSLKFYYYYYYYYRYVVKGKKDHTRQG